MERIESLRSPGGMGFQEHEEEGWSYTTSSSFWSTENTDFMDVNVAKPVDLVGGV